MRRPRGRTIIVAVVVALAAVVVVWWPRSVEKRVNDILGDPAARRTQSYENARPITKSQMLELLKLTSIDARRFKLSERILVLTGGRVHVSAPSYVSIRIMTAGKNVVLEPLLEIARDKTIDVNARLWVLELLSYFNDQRVFDAWMEFIESAPMFSEYLLAVLPLPLDWVRIDTNSLSATAEKDTPGKSRTELLLEALRERVSALKKEMARKTYEEFVLELLDTAVRDPKLAPNDFRILRWLDRYGGYDVGAMLAQYSPEAAKFRDDAIRKGYRPYVDVYSSLFVRTDKEYLRTSPYARFLFSKERKEYLNEKALKRLLPDERERGACRALLRFYCEIDDPQFSEKMLDDKWRERFVQWYTEARPYLKHDPMLGGFVVSRPVASEAGAAPEVGGTRPDVAASSDNYTESAGKEAVAEAIAGSSSGVKQELASNAATGTGPDVAQARDARQDAGAPPGVSRAIVNESLKTADPSDRFYAIQSLGQERDKTAVDDLLVLLSDQVPEVREAAAKALGHIGDPRAGDALAKVMDSDGDEWVRNIAARALAEMSDPRARPMPLDPVDEGALSRKDEPVEWNADVKTTILDLSKSTKIGKRVNDCWPSPIRLENMPVDAGTGEELLRRLKRIVKATYLPGSLVSHLIRYRSVSIREQDFAGAGVEVEPALKPKTSGALVVCYRIKDFILQIQDTDYDTFIYVAREDAKGKRRNDGLQYMVEMAATIFKSHMARRAGSTEELVDMSDGKLREGVPQNDVQWPNPVMSFYDRKDARELRAFCRSSGLYPAWFYGGTDGYWVEFRMMKEGDRSLPKLSEERSKELTGTPDE